MTRSPEIRAAMRHWSALPLRLMVGGGFLVHGYLKLGRGVDVFAAALAGLHIPAPLIMAWTTVTIELLAGVAVLVGAYVTLMSVPMSIVLGVAIVKVHAQFGFSSIKFLAVTEAGPQFGKPGVECDLLYLACIAALLLLPPDPASLDHWRARRNLAAGFRRLWGRGGDLALRSPVTEVRDVRREEHGPVPLEEQARLARESGYA
jgi:putative oxidoreductase